MALVSGIRTFRGVTEISVDGTPLLRVREREFSRHPLAVGDAFESEEYMDRVAQSQLNDAYDRALTSLDFSARTAREIEKTLSQRGFVPPVVECVLERLRKNGLIDDARYAQRAVEVSSARPVGVYAMKRKLRAKGVSEEDCERALGAMDEEQQASAAQEAAARLGKRYEGLPAREAKAKLSQSLARRGFSWEAIHLAVEARFDTDDEE